VPLFANLRTISLSDGEENRCAEGSWFKIRWCNTIFANFGHSSASQQLALVFDRA
jgi:hypothetical protein